MIKIFRAAPLLRSTLILLSISVLQTTGCGGGGNIAPATPLTAPTITSQPGNETVPITQTGTFTVAAAGSSVLTYQWQKNGTPISGATAATLTTSPVTLSDSGAVFAVTISNSVGSVTSAPATLTVGPRSPRAGDLRFKLVGQALHALQVSNILGGAPGFESLSFVASEEFGTPLQVGDQGFQCSPMQCSWGYEIFDLPSTVHGITTSYIPGRLSTLTADLNALSSSAVIVTSLDEEPDDDAYAISYVRVSPAGNQPLGFTQTFSSATLPGLQAIAAQQGALSRVVTAISYNPITGDADFLSYGWQTDTSTVYETKVVLSSFTSIESDGAALALAGYIITATGSGPNRGYILVGTRVQGDTLARPFASGNFPNPAFPSFNFAPVALLGGPGGFLAEL